MAANLNKNLSSKSLILEQNNKTATKLLISGGSKCNITNKNISTKNYLFNYPFLKQSLDEFSYKDNLGFFYPLEFDMVKDKQFFAKSAKLVKEKLLQKIQTQIKTNTKVISVKKDKNGLFRVFTQNEIYFTKYLVIATGGISFKELGVSQLALDIARDFDIGYNDFSPALVPFSLQKEDFWLKTLSGISVDVEISFFNKDKISHKINSSLLCTHKGISGPAILQASLWWKKGSFFINFLPKYELKSIKQNKKQLSSILPLPKNFIKAFLNHNALDDKPCYKYTNDELKIISNLYSYKLSPAGTLGFNKAEISKGGVFELDENYQSPINGLFFIGECVDVSGMMGGFNIHFAFASAKKLSNYLATLE